MIDIEHFISNHMYCSWRIYDLTGSYDKVKEWWSVPIRELDNKSPSEYFKESDENQKRLKEYVLGLNKKCF